MASSAAAIVERLAVVTGANQGIGYEIARALGGVPGIHVIATSRDAGRGAAAVAAMQAGLSAAEVDAGAKPPAAAAGARPLCDVSTAQLDVASPSSVAAFAELVAAKYGGVVDILVNNAGIAYKGDTFGAEEARTTIATNVRGTMAVTDALLPFIKASKAGPRIVNVCSMAGRLSQVSPPLQARFQDPRATSASVVELMDEFVGSVADDSYASKGWPRSMYGISKLGEMAYTFLLARELQPAGVVVNACCPGYCSTAMSSHRGTRTAAKGAETPVWLATRPGGSVAELTGGFWQDLALKAW
jgi:carbonyl reductase 1